MDLNKVLAQLREELSNLDAAIMSLERLRQQQAPRRGRPPKSLLTSGKPQQELPPASGGGAR
jgi:hypothetical protein